LLGPIIAPLPNNASRPCGPLADGYLCGIEPGISGMLGLILV
jgi:hypothetical protein